MSLLIEEDVPRLDVAVDGPARVDEVEGIGDRRQPAQDLLDGGAALRLDHPIFQGAAPQVLQDEERHLLVLALRQDPDDVRVLQSHQLLHLAVEPRPEPRLRDEAHVGHLDDDGATEVRVASPVDAAHPPIGQLLLDLVDAEQQRTREVDAEPVRHVAVRGRLSAHARSLPSGSGSFPLGLG